MIPMALHDRIRKLTYEDYVLIPNDGQRHEIIDGEHYVTAAPFLPHADVSTELAAQLRLFVRRHRLGRVYHAPCDVLLSEHDVVQPDVLFVSNARARILADRKNVKGAPDLVIEILSKSTRRLDEETKLDLYDRYDVLEYWIVDPDRRTAQVYRRAAEGLRLDSELSAGAGEFLTSPLLPGFSLPLADIFES
jgi:Uma2 family endonuclease